ncbi:hypothetical protein D3C74_445890 [compost metagenome]
MTYEAPATPASSRAFLPSATLVSKPASSSAPSSSVPVAVASVSTVWRMYPIGSVPSEPRSVTTGAMSASWSITLSGVSVVTAMSWGSSAEIASRLGSPRIPTSGVDASRGTEVSQVL